jgi:hypothetical protein
VTIPPPPPGKRNITVPMMIIGFVAGVVTVVLVIRLLY